ncbi:hypothetical protein MHYP_G00186410 [Metynnis hypsauchen]
MRKADFDNVALWWEVVKTQIKSFCQLYSTHVASVVKGTVRGLEREISLIEEELVKKYDAGVSNLLERKRKDLGSYLYEEAKGALIRARVSSTKDMDAPTAFFFNFERKGNHQNPMQFLQHPEGHLTSVPAEMRKIAVDFYTDLYSVVTELTFKSIRLRFQRAGITKLGDLRFDEDWKSGEVLRAATGIMSVRLLQRIVGGVASSLPTFLKEALQHHSAGDQETFPSLPIAVEMGDHQEEEGALLSFRTSQLAGSAEVSKKALYSICVKVLHRNSLDGLKESRWLGLLAPASSPQGSWRSLYKPPIEKSAGDLQWRIVHGAVATNRHVAHIDPIIGSECPFCGREEAVEHLFLHCIRLTGLLNLLKAWCCDLGILWTDSLYVFGPKYVAAYGEKLCLLNFLIGQGKLAVWLTRKNKLQGSGTLDPELMLRAAVRIRLRIEYAYFKTNHNLPAFHRVARVSEEAGPGTSRGEGRWVSVDQSAGPGKGTEERPDAAAAAHISVSDSVSEVGVHGVETVHLDGSQASLKAHEGEGNSETALSAHVEAASSGDAAVGESVVSVDMPVTQEEEEAFSDFSDMASQAGEDQLFYSVQEINTFLVETFGKVVEIADFFPHVERFMASVAKIRRTANFDDLSKKKMFRLKKILMKLQRGKAPVKQKCSD